MKLISILGIFLFNFIVTIIVVVIPGLILAAIFLLIKTKLISKTFKILIIIMILIFLLIILINFAYVERPNDSYIKMKQFSNHKNVIGLSKEQVVELIGEPEYEACDENKNLYSYHAGTVFRYVTWRGHTLWAHTSYYVLLINFDETDEVESTLIEEYTPPGG